MGAPVRKLVFMGSPVFAVPSLKLLVDRGFEVIAVYTQPPRPAGRKGVLTPTPIQLAAEEMGLPVFSPEKLRGDDLDALLARDFDAICVVGYGMLLPKALVEHHLCLNVHPSALPRWRGSTPVQSAIRAGDTTTDVCVMRLEAGMDTGPVYDRTPVAIGPEMTSGDLNDVVWPLGAERLVWVLKNIENLTPVPQPAEGVTLATKVTPEWRPLDWTRPAAALFDQIRALLPAPGATCEMGSETVKIGGAVVEKASEAGAPGCVVGAGPDGVRVVCGDGAVLRLTRLQRPGKTMLPVADVLRGFEVGVGSLLS